MKSILSLLPLAALVLAHEQLFDQTPLADHLADQLVLETDIPPITEPLTADAIPLLGFGTWRLTTNTSQAVSWAIQTGYRHIDCAAAYGNEEDVGIGIKDGLEKTGLTRDDLWITSKLWNDHHEPLKVEAGIDDTISKLGVGYLNLYLMHWPVGDLLGAKSIEYLNTWEAMGELVDKRKTSHIGVANFNEHQMKQLLKYGSHQPQVHQMELHPYLNQTDFVKWHQDLNIHVTAYSPLAATNDIYDPGTPTQLLNNSVITKIASKRNCTPAQVAIMWAMARGTSVIPKSSHNERVTENFHSLECVLHKSDFEKIGELGEAHHRFNNPGKSWRVPLYEGLEDWKGKHRKDE